MANCFVKFQDLLSLGLGFSCVEETCSVLPEDWTVLFKMGAEHGVTGILFSALEKLPAEQRPPSALLLQWIGIAERIKRRNIILNEKCAEVCRQLESVGLDALILKGQGIARLYPQPLLRQSGDIDVWVKPKENFGAGINRSVCDIRRRLSAIGKGRVGKIVYHHVEWLLSGVMVEVHFRPQQLNAPLANGRFQEWCNAQWQKMNAEGCWMDGGLAFKVPFTDFNIIYLMAHMYHHLLFEGLKMKQVCDYAVLLGRNEDATLDDQRGGQLKIRNDEFAETLCSFGMLRFARGMMWIMGEVFHIDSENMITEPDEKEGRFILSEIMRGNDESCRKSGESIIVRFWRRTKYRHRFLMHYPSEILWDIPFRLYHWCWRQKHN